MNIKVQVPAIIDDEVTARLDEILFDVSAMHQYGGVHIQFTVDADSNTFVYECGDFFLNGMTTRDMLWNIIGADCEEEMVAFNRTIEWLGVTNHPSLIIVCPKSQTEYINALNTYANSYVQISINPKWIGNEYDYIRKTEQGWTLYWDGATPF